jgi:uncharacterized membrane protein YphA (DoxX/SURF4 family)
MADRPRKIAAATRWILGFAIGALFLYAGAIKAADPARFSADITNYRLMPQLMAAAVALYLPWLEIVCGMGLIFQKLYRGALLILSGLCVVFLLALISALARGLDISCGCFGHSHPHPVGAAILLDIALLGILVALLCLERASTRV